MRLFLFLFCLWGIFGAEFPLDRPLEEDKPELHQKRINAQFGKKVKIRYIGSKGIFVSQVNPLRIEHECLLQLRLTKGKSTYTSFRVLEFMADKLRISPGENPHVVFYDLSDTMCVNRIVRSTDEVILEDVLPKCPEGIRCWDYAEFNSKGEPLFFLHLSHCGRQGHYYTLKNNILRLLHIGDSPRTFLKKEFSNSDTAENVYRISYSLNSLNSLSRLSLEFLNQENLEFELTNVNNVPISVVSYLISNEHIKHTPYFIPSSENPRNILAIRNFNKADMTTGWDFIGESGMALKQQYQEWIDRLRQHWRREGRIFAEAPFSVNAIYLKQHDQIGALSYGFPQNSELEDCTFMGEGNVWKPSARLSENPSKKVCLHSPLQYKSVMVNGHEVPYCYVPSAGDPSGRTVILMYGGPINYYAGGFSKIIDYYTKKGWAVIIPQESSRTGFGWEHFARGLGEMGRGNLYQLLHVFQDAIRKKLIADPNKVSLYGHSYGGFVACSFALRWDELHEEAHIKKRFNLQSIIADAAWVENSLPRMYSDRLLFPEGVDERAHIEHVMPIYRTGMPLSAQLFLVHGELDTRCSARYAKRFGEMLEKSGKSVPLFWHSGDHSRPKHSDYPEFLERLMLDQEVTDETVKLARRIGLKHKDKGYSFPKVCVYTIASVAIFRLFKGFFLKV